MYLLTTFNRKQRKDKGTKRLTKGYKTKALSDKEINKLLTIYLKKHKY